MEYGAHSANTHTHIELVFDVCDFVCISLAEHRFISNDGKDFLRFSVEFDRLKGSFVFETYSMDDGRMETEKKIEN